LLRKREKKRGERRGKKIQRDGGGLDGLREGYGVGQHAEHGLIQLEDMQKVQCRLKKYSRQDRYALEEIKWRWLASAIIARAEDQASRVGLEGKVLPAFHSVLAQDRAGGRCDWALPKVQVPFLSHIIPVYWGISIATTKC
jgi:hypothetical protein